MQITYQTILDNLVSSLLFVILSFIMVRWLIPVVRGLLSSDIKLHNTSWHGQKSPDDPTPDGSKLTFSQFGERATATLDLSTDTGVRTFHYKGRYRAGQIALTWEEKGSAGYNLGTFALHLQGDLRTLRGVTAYLSHTKGGLVTKNRVYRKAAS